MFALCRRFFAPVMAIVLILATLPASAAAPERIISIGAPITEILFKIGLGDKLVAVDLTSRYPTAAAALPKVGYMRALSAEGILSLAPDLMIVSAEAGPPEVLNQLRAAGVRIEMIDETPSMAGLTAKITTVSAITDKPAEGAKLLADVQAQMALLSEALKQSGPQPRVLFLHSITNGPPLAAGAGSLPEALIKLAGGVNAVQGFDGFKPLSVEAATAAAPDVIMVSTGTVEQLGGAQGILALPQVAITPAARLGRVVALDGPLLMGFGPRTPQAIQTLAKSFHPDVKAVQ